MYWFITRNHPYLDELNNNYGRNSHKKDFEEMEIDLKKKFAKVNEFDPEDCYNYENNSDDDDSLSSQDELEDLVGTNRQTPPLSSSGTKQSFLTAKVGSSVGRRTKILDKIITFKTYIKVVDIICAITIIFGAILAQFENEYYYMDNIYNRVTGVLLIHEIFLNPGNNTWESTFSDTKVNLTLLTEWDGPTMSSLTLNFLRNSMNNNTSQFSEVTNADILAAHIKREEFAYTDNMTETSFVKIPLKLNEFNKNLRIIILLSTMLSVLLLFLSRYLEYLREYTYKKDKPTPFYKSKFCLYMLYEYFLLSIIQYPGVNNSITFISLGSTTCLPISSILASFSIFRLVFIYKILKCFTIWNSHLAEVKCEKYVCNSDSVFAFKALQKERPFLTLLLIFVLTCVCFGISLRIFEMHYWESQVLFSQNWRYLWNALWCVFVSITTVGYGDFYPKTNFGRFIIIVACIIGIYFVSMMMVVMTQKSILNESEQKAYKLITRLKLRSEIKNIQSQIVWNALRMSILKKEKIRKMSNKQFEINYNYEKRCITACIEKKKIIERDIRTFDIVPTKEQLYDISERMDQDIREIRREIDSMRLINNSVVGYTESQMDMIRYLKKNIYATRLMYDTIEQKPHVFGELSKFDRKILKENYLDKELDYYRKNYEMQKSTNDMMDTNKTNEAQVEINNKPKIIVDTKIPELNLLKVNKEQQEINPDPPINERGTVYESDDYSEYYTEELSKYNVSPSEFKAHFNILFLNSSDISKKTMNKNTAKTITNIKNMKDYQKKLEMIMMIKKTIKSPRKKR